MQCKILPKSCHFSFGTFNWTHYFPAIFFSLEQNKQNANWQPCPYPLGKKGRAKGEEEEEEAFFAWQTVHLKALSSLFVAKDFD